MSRKSARIASLPTPKLAEEEEDEVQEEEKEEKPKKRKAPAAKGKGKGKAVAEKEEKEEEEAPVAAHKGKGKEKDVAEEKEEEEEEEPKKKSKKSKVSNGQSPDTTNATVTLASVAEAAKGSKKMQQILTIDSSSSPTATTTTTTTTTTDSDGSFTTSIVYVQGLEASAWEKHFDEISDALLNHAIFFIGGLPHRLMEVEFYVNGYKHVDDFAHGHARQKTRNQWYFHMHGKAYKGGTYKGLDITFGDDNCYGGILLRALQPLYGDFQPVEGPSLLVDHVLKTTGYEKIEDLVRKFDLSAEVDLEKVDDLASVKHPLFVVHYDKELPGVPVHKVHKSARVGLSMKAFTDGKQNYVGKFYRYLIMPEKIKKGRHYFVSSLHQQGYSAKEIVSFTKGTNASVEKFIGLFNGGKAKDYKKFCGVNLSDAEVCEMVGSCAAFCYPPTSQ